VFEVHLSDSAKLDLRTNVDWWSENRSEIEAERWYDAIMEAIYSLERTPRRCIAAREAERLGVKLKNLWFGMSSKQTHRVLFTVDGSRVNVLRVLSTRQNTDNLNLCPEG
jgi:plasmid stabilization system protein ParE